MRFIEKIILALCFALPLGAIPTVTLTGSLNAPDGTGMNGTLYLALSQIAALSNANSCGGPIEVLPTVQIAIKVIAGVMQSPPPVYGNDCMLPQGTWYNAKFIDSGSNVIFTDRWYLCCASNVNVGNIVSMVIAGTTASFGAPGTLLTAPVSNQTIVQQPGTALSINNFTVTGTLTGPNGATCTSTGCTGFLGTNTLTTSGNYTITGSWTFDNDLLGAPTRSIGSNTFPFAFGFFANGIVTTDVKMEFAPSGLGSPGDFFVWRNDAIHHFELLDSTSAPVIQFDATSAATFTWAGHMVPDTNDTWDLGAAGASWRDLYVVGPIHGPSVNGADLACGGAIDGTHLFRVDTHELQACFGGSMWKVALAP